MTADRYRAVENQGGCADLSARAKFRLTGADRVRYLNGQVTNDVRRAGSASALHACVVSAKGRIEAEVFIHVPPDGDALMLDAEPGLRELLAARLDRYIVADDVTLEDVTDHWSILHCFAGSHGSAVRDECVGESPALSCSRFGTPGVDVWRPASAAVPIDPSSLISAEDLEILRVLRGIPRWPQELNLDAFPQEAGIESEVMDFTKGCYIGQEVLSRIKTTGKMPRVLRRFRVTDPDLQVEPGMMLVTRDKGPDAREAGTVTSVARHPMLDRVVGLAYVRQAVEGVDSLLLASGDPPRIFGDIEITPA